MNSKISYAVAAILGGSSCAAYAAEPAAGGAEAGSGALEEITVTAQRRTQYIQDVPISMQALTAQALQQLNVSTLDDYVRFLPNVTTANNGPGQNEVFMRGLSAGSQASQGSGSTGVWPNVAIYLDNQSGQLPNRNLDIYAADLNRIEVLEGPQGTLFGAGAEAGVIRYITNEPKLDLTEANVKAGYGVTAHGDPNTDLTAVVNLPLIADKMAVRTVIYDDRRGGSMDNVQPLQVPVFNSAHDKDRFKSTAWTVNGRLGALKAVYTGGYLVRNVDQIGDYTNYARGVFADYYQCYGPTIYDTTLTPTCFSPSSIWHATERNTHQQHELRLSTPDDWRLRAIAGAYWEDNKLYDQTGWLYKTVPPCTATRTTGCLANVGTFPGTTVQNPGVQSDNTSFYQDQVRETKQTAFFASVDVDLIPKVLTATLGTRHFRFDNSMAGSVLSSFGCFEAGVPSGGCQSAFSFNLNAQNLSGTESGYKSRGDLTWHITPDVMAYYTFSQGFRPGGFNQNGVDVNGVAFRYAPGPAQPVNGVPTGVPQYAVPKSYSSDKLTNNEIGWKTEFLDRRLQWNGALYRENWDNVQVAFFDPGVTGNIFFDTNGQNFLIKGVETSLVARVVTGLTLQGAASWNQS